MVGPRLKRLVTLSVFLLALAVGCGEANDPGDRPAQQLSRDTLQPIPIPHLGHLEVSSRLQIEQMHERVKTLSDTHPGSPLLAKAYGQLGNLFNAHLLNDAAEVCYRNAELLAPEDYRWTYFRAHLFRRAGEDAIAMRGLQRALQLMKLDVSVEPQQLVAALTWLGTLHQAAGDHANAKLMYEQAIKINSRTVLARVALAQIAATEGDHATAIEKLEAIRSEHQDNTQAHNSVNYQLAMSYRALGDNERARQLLDEADAGGAMAVADPLLRAMQDSAINSTALVRRGRNAIENGQVGVAMELYRDALEIDPDNYYAHLQLATALVRTGDTDQALSHVRRATELQPQSGVVWGRLSRVLRMQGEFAQALVAIETARAFEPDNVEIELDYARLLLENFDRPGDALSHFDQVLEREPANVRAHAGRAAALRRSGGCEASLESLEEAHTRLPTSHVLADGLARTLLACGSDDGSRVLTLAQQAFDALNKSRYADTLARAYAAGGDFDSAVRQQEQAIELARGEGFNTEPLERVLRERYRQDLPWQRLQ